MLAERGDKGKLGVSQVLVDQKREQLNIIKNLKNETFTFTPAEEKLNTLFSQVLIKNTQVLYIE